MNQGRDTLRTVKRIVIPALILLASCSSTTTPIAASLPPSAPPSTAPVTTKAAPAPKTTAPPAWETSLAQFEKDNAIPSSSWYPQITGREIKYGNSLWVYTKLPVDAEAKTYASGICGTYAQYVLVDVKVRTTFVRAADGNQIAKCGPGA